MKDLLRIDNLQVSVDETQILNGVNLLIKQGQVHAIMGPNGSGKSTLAFTIMGHPSYKIVGGSLIFCGLNPPVDISSIPVDERARAGIFLAFQNPLEIEGVTLREFLYQAYQAKNNGLNPSVEGSSVKDFEEALIRGIKLLDIKPEFVERSFNLGFSGGEKKRIEMLQLAVLKPTLVILDEIDSGLDVDALQVICKGLNAIKKDNPNMAMLIITHYPRILHYVIPDFVHILQKGTIVQSGSKELAEQIEKEGYDKINNLS